MRFLAALRNRLPWDKLARFTPSRVTVRRSVFVAGFLGCTAAAFWFGRQAAPRAQATQPGALAKAADHAKGIPTDVRVVAHIYNTIPITREELGEYLITRYGVERVEMLVNRRIIERACAARGIVVTNAEVEAQFKADLARFPTPLTPQDFANTVLKRFNKSLYEWKEDVIRPKLALSRLAHSDIKVSAADIDKAYEIEYGHKVEVRIICFAKEDTAVSRVYEDIRRGGEDAFREQARKQFISKLAQDGGKIPPIHRHYPDSDLEKEAFSLREGELSSLITLKDGSRVLMKCDKHLKADTSIPKEKVRLKLERDIFELKVAERIPIIFDQLKKEANAKIYLRERESAAELDRAVNKELGLDLPSR